MANTAEVVVATLNVNFSAEDGSGGSGAGIKLEIDDREDGLNNGDTSFAPGDDAYFFMFVDESRVELITTTPVTTAGGVSSAGTGTKDIDEHITFSNSSEAQLGYYPSGSVTYRWLGRAYSLDSRTNVLTSYSTPPVQSGATLSIADGKNVFGIITAQYQAQGSLWKLKGVPEDFTEAMIIAIGVTIP